MVIPKGYKETELGILPTDWDVLKIKKLFDLNYANVQTGPFGTVLSSSEYSLFGTPVISVREIRNGTIKIVRETPRVPVDICKRLPQYLLKENDLVFARKGSVERNSLVTTKEDGYFLGSDGIRLRLTNEQYDPKYLAHFFRSYIIQNHLTRASYGSTMAGLNEAIISQLLIAVPSTITEQQAIATALSDVDKLIDSLENLIEKKKAIKHGVMHELLIKDAQNWNRCFLGDICDVESGTIITEGTIRDGAIPVIAGGKYPAYYHAEANRTSNTITISASGANAGFISFYDKPIYASDCSTISAAKTYDVKFIYYLLLINQSKITNLQSGGAQPHVRPTDLKRLNFAIPFFLKEQHRISKILSDMDTEIDALTQKLEKSRQVKQGMMQELLTGRIRLLETATQKQKKAKAKKVQKAETEQQNHNEHFHEAVILSTVVSLFTSEQFPLGRFRRQKFAYLLHRHAQESTQGFLKKAAGPYNPTIRYKDEKIALKAKYVIELGKGKFVQGEKSNEAVAYFVQWYGEGAIEWIKQFQYRKNDDLEVLTTVAEAIVDLKKCDLAITVESVKQVIRENPEWRPKLDKDCFNDFKIQAAIKESQKLFA